MIHAREDYNRIQDPAGKIAEDEPVFLIRASDKLMVPALCAYAKLCEDYPGYFPLLDEVRVSVLDFIKTVEARQKIHSTKLPDL